LLAGPASLIPRLKLRARRRVSFPFRSGIPGKSAGSDDRKCHASFSCHLEERSGADKEITAGLSAGQKREGGIKDRLAKRSRDFALFTYVDRMADQAKIKMPSST